jgi:signal transduction histidine kinase
MNWHAPFGPWLWVVTIVSLAIVAVGIGIAFHDPFDFDDRPHIERLMKLALANVQGDIAADMDERVWAQVKLADAGNLSTMSNRDWGLTSRWFLTHNIGYLGLQLLDQTYHKRRTAALPEAEGLDATIDFLADSRLQHMLRTAATSTVRVATAQISLPNGRPGHLVAVPDFAHGEIVGFLVVISDLEKMLDSVLSEFTGLGYSVAVLDNSRQLYATAGSENRKEWGQRAKVPLSVVDWQVEVWPKPEMLAETRSSLPELLATFTLLLLLLLGSTVHLAHLLHVKSVLLRGAHDELELRVLERTAQLEQANEAILHAQDEERRRIARELHDSTVQLMGALAIDLEKLERLVPGGDSAKARRILADSSELVERATTELRTVSYLLHPPILDDLGLEGALPWYASGFSGRSGIQVKVDLQPDLGRLPHGLELTVFRMVQEGLTNIHRHSGSTTAEITLFRDADRVTLEIRDHGRGISSGVLEPVRNAGVAVGVGIPGMRERVRSLGGHLEILSGDDGTLIRAVLPVGEEKSVSEHASDRASG